MAKHKRKGSGWWVACGVVVVGVILIGVIVSIYWFTPLGKSVPTVQILQPTQVLEIQSGQAVVLKARGESTSYIQRIDFLVNGIPINQVVSSQPQLQSLDASFPWFSSQPGVHQLSVIAYDQAGNASTPAEVFILVTARNTGWNSQLQSGGSGNGNVGGNGSASEEESQVNLDQILQNLDPGANFPVDFPGQPIDLSPEITMFQVEAERSGDQVSALYSLAASDDLGLARITIYLSSLDDPLNPVSNTQVACGGESACTTEGQIAIPSGGWLLSVQAEDTSGQVSPMRTRQIHVLLGDGQQAFALEDEDTLIQLDPNTDWGEIQFVDTDGDDLGEPRLFGYGCSGQIVVLEVPYTYATEHGEEVYVEARAENGNIMVAAGNVRVQHGSGFARIEMGQILPESLYTEKLELLLMASGGDYFYSEDVNFPIIWPTQQPDLRVVSADIRGDRQIVSIQNMGCSSVEGFSLLLKPLDSEGETVFLDTVIPAGGAYDWLPITDPNRFALGFQIILDPENTIEEINEANNSFEAGPLTLEYIHIYKIDIHDTRDDEWHQDSIDGEFQLTAFVNGIYAYRPQVEGANWVLTKGQHEIGGLVAPIMITPPLEWNQDLFVALEIWEDDDFGARDQDIVQFTHSWDLSQEYNWKNGGTFSATSEDGTFTLYWQLVVER